MLKYSTNFSLLRLFFSNLSICNQIHMQKWIHQHSFICQHSSNKIVNAIYLQVNHYSPTKIYKTFFIYSKIHFLISININSKYEIISYYSKPYMIPFKLISPINQHNKSIEISYIKVN